MARNDRGAKPRRMGTRPDGSRDNYTAARQEENNAQATFTAAVG